MKVIQQMGPACEINPIGNGRQTFQQHASHTYAHHRCGHHAGRNAVKQSSLEFPDENCCRASPYDLNSDRQTIVYYLLLSRCSGGQYVLFFLFPICVKGRAEGSFLRANRRSCSDYCTFISDFSCLCLVSLNLKGLWHILC